MKRYITLLLTITCFLGYSQDFTRKGFFNKTKIGILIRTKTNPEPISTSQLNKSGNGTEISTINGWYINPKLAIGLGIGVTSYINPTVSFYPVFTNIHYYFLNQIKTPFVFTNIGYNIEFDSFLKGGLLYEAGLGYNLKIGKKIALTPEIAYKTQNYREIFFTDEKASLQSFSLGIGILF